MLKHLLALFLAFVAATAFAAVDLNKADQAELETVKGIGPALSQRLLDERKKAPFKDWPDLIERVKGVGSGNAARFSAGGLTINGAAYAGAPAAAPKASAAERGAHKGTAASAATPERGPAPRVTPSGTVSAPTTGRSGATTGSRAASAAPAASRP